LVLSFGSKISGRSMVDRRDGFHIIVIFLFKFDI